MAKTPDTINEALQDKQRKDDKQQEAQESVDMRTIMSMPEGRRVMYRILELCGCGVLNTDPTSYSLDGLSDPHATYAEIGERMLGEKIKVDILTLAPDMFTVMMTEEATKAAEEIKHAKLSTARGEETNDGPE